MAYSPSQNRATQKYLRENKEQLRVWVSKGKLEKYKKWAAAQGNSLSEYVVGLIEEDMESRGYKLD